MVYSLFPSPNLPIREMPFLMQVLWYAYLQCQMSFDFIFFFLHRWRKMCNANENNGFMTQKVIVKILSLNIVTVFGIQINVEWMMTLFFVSSSFSPSLFLFSWLLSFCGVRVPYFFFRKGDLCQPLNCKKRELCLLEDAFTALCVSKTMLHKNRFVWRKNTKYLCTVHHIKTMAL